MSFKVLVADDSGVMRKIITRSLNAIGYNDVVEAADGDEAFAKISGEPFQLVLTDWNMPGKTGIELVRAIRSIGSTVPVMMITTEAEKSRVIEAIEAGATDYLVKPFEGQQLQAKLEKLCAQ